ncbi:MAG: N-acetylglucosaminyldiphosphoundecaprenol N-acetyl-beta-D-mannosaminyltransferase [Chloroflexota bacterium]|nr:N-acetylglucosaminyldiphosphoundecaprenol N-acetyl-beta-D-mannosaminyltransferase [Chloroflexota bacterium]
MHYAVRILDVEVDAVTADEAVGLITDAIDARHGHGAPSFQVATVNPEFVMHARRDAAFRRILRDCALRTPDGAGLMLGARILGHPLPQRVPGVEMVIDLARAAATRGDRLFLLGGAPGVAEAAAEALRRAAPGVEVAGTLAGDAGEEGDAAALSAISASGADIVLVAFGAPAQELWSSRNLAVSGAAVAIGVGGTFDYLSGTVRRAPRVMRRLGLEWLFRLAQQPSRWRRMAVLPVFLLLVVRQRVLRR